MSLFSRKTPDTAPPEDVNPFRVPTALDMIAAVEDPKTLRVVVGGDEIPEIGYDHDEALRRAEQNLAAVLAQRREAQKP
jgi:hypothetical protein